MPEIRVAHQADPAERSVRRAESKRVVWYHFGLVALLGVASQLAMATTWSLQDGQGMITAVARALPAIGGWLYGVLPIAVGVSVVMVRPLDRDRLLRLAVVGLAAMVVTDIASPAVTLQIGQSSGFVRGEEIASLEVVDFSVVSAIRTTPSLLAKADGVGERLSGTYPAGHPRAEAARAIAKVSFLALPLVMAALMGALLLWIDEEIVFKRAGTGTAFRVWTAWILVPTSYWLWGELVERARHYSMFRGGALPMILLPIIPFGILAWLAWKRIPADADA